MTALSAEVTTTTDSFARAAPAAQALVVAGAAIGLALGAAANDAADFQSLLITTQNNTTLTNDDMATMQDTITKLGASAPVALDQLADGFRHVVNFGFSAADATLVLDAAMKSAVSTGGNTAETAEVLAAAMHEFGINADQAAKTMDELHIAAAEGNTTLEQFSGSFGQVAAIASAVGVPLDQAAAAMSALTRHGFDAATAGVQVKDLLQHLINPSAAAEKSIKDLSQRSGVDLVNAFTATGVHANGLEGTIELVRGAMDKLNLTQDQQTALWLKLIPNIRGGVASFVLAGRGADDFTGILKDMHESLGITDEAFDRLQRTANFQWGVLTNDLKLLGIAIGNTLLPSLTDAFAVMSGFVRAVTDLPQPVLAALTSIAGIAGIAALAVGGFVLLSPVVAAVGASVGALASILVALAPVILAVVAVVGVLAAAWQEDLFGIREVVQTAFDAIPGILDNLGQKFNEAGVFWQSTIVPAIETIANVVAQKLIPIFNAIASGPLSGLGELFKRIFTGDMTGALDLFENILIRLAPGLGTFFVKVRGVLDAIGTAIQQTVGFLGPILGNLGLALSKAFSGDFAGAADTLRAIIGALAPQLLTLADDVLPVLQGVSARVAEIWSDNLSPAFQAVAGFVANTILPFLGDLAANAMPTLAAASSALGDIWNTKLAPAFETVGAFLSTTVGPFLQDISGKAMPALASASEAVATLWDTKLGPAFSAVGDVAGKVVDFYRPLVEILGFIANEVGKELIQFFLDLGPAIVTFGGVVQQTLPLLGSIAEFFGALSSVIGTLAHIGIEVLQGLFQDVLVPGFQALGTTLGPLVPAFGTAGAAFHDMGTDLSVIGEALKPLKQFFDDATAGLLAFQAAADKFKVPDFSGLNPFANRGAPGGEGQGGPGLQKTSFIPGGGVNGGGSPLVSIGTIIVSNEADAIALAERLAAAINNSTKRITPPTPAQQPGLVAASV